MKKELLIAELEKTDGIFTLAPAWVPRSFMIPGKRLKLHPDDLYALGKERGGINERWFASTTQADNGPETPVDEGLSYIVIKNEGQIHKVLLKEAIEIMGDDLLGKAVMKTHGGWTVLTKFFDNYGPIPFHIHQMEEHAKDVGKDGKPESYYFPPQYNQIVNAFPYTFFGLDSITTKEDIKRCLANWENGDNDILKYSKAYRLTPGTGWDVPAGILHAPGSLVTYELQKNVDIFGMFQSIVEGRSVPRELLVKDVPEEKYEDLDYLVGIVDWETNTDPNFMKNHYRIPKPVSQLENMQEQGFEEYWIVYDNEYYSAKELTVYPGKSVHITDDEAYGFIVVQGRGYLDRVNVECPGMVRFTDLTSDEGFVTKNKAKNGITIKNESEVENLVMLKHFGPRV